MPTRSSSAVWEGNLREGKGTMKLGSGAFEGSYSFPSRFESGQGTNPEELIGAAHAGCFSMAFANELSSAGHTPDSIMTEAKVTLDQVEGGFAITGIALSCEAKVPGIDEATFQDIAEAAKNGCPVSKALTGTEITLDAKLV
ncbi:MAG: OsmC family protein [Trueperaceae bacterium]|nr:OsmC family protein [Trueperaceae bacterium]